ncbi:hypothetical protein AOLI_G00134600 [Acnodon oligacanthus]
MRAKLYLTCEGLNVTPAHLHRLGREMRPGERCGIWALCPNLVPEPARDTTRSAKPAHNLCNLSQTQPQHSHSRSLCLTVLGFTALQEEKEASAIATSLQTPELHVI